MEVRHHRQWQFPAAVRWPIDHLGVLQWHVIVEPIKHSIVFILVQLHLDRVQRFHTEDVVSVV
jgi:hypothetical protein